MARSALEGLVEDATHLKYDGVWYDAEFPGGPSCVGCHLFRGAGRCGNDTRCSHLIRADKLDVIWIKHG